MKQIILFIFLFFTCSSFAGQRDARVREYISPVRIVWQQHENRIQNVQTLLRPGIGQSNLVNASVCKIKSSGSEHPAILLDFGKELQGGLQIVTGMYPVHKPIAVRIRFGESVGEVMSDIDGVNGASNDHALRDFIQLLPWLGVAETGSSGFRFVRIDLVDDSVELHLKEIRAVSVFRDIPYRGSFQSNDDRLNQIWKTGAYTVHLNMQEYLWDGIKRDRLVWVGDLHPEVMTVSTVFGSNEVVPKSLDLIRETTPLPQWMNGISSYSIWWLLIQRDWYYYQGNYVYLKEQREYLTGLIRQLLSKIDKQGKEQLDGNRFLDWPSSNNKEAVQIGLQSLMVMALSAGEDLCTILEEPVLASECRDKKERAVRWAKKAGREMILHVRTSPSDPGNKQAVALLALAGIISPREASEKVLEVDGARGFSTFYGYYMLRAMAEAGNYQGALQIIRQYWGAMIDLGATTFWEDFNMDWLADAARIDELIPPGKKDIHREYGDYCYKGYRHSFCHGWASGPTAWLSEYVLGVQVIEPGCRTVRIAPHLGDLQWVEGTFPTPYGEIKLRHEKQVDGTIKSTVDAPKEIRILQ